VARDLVPVEMHTPLAALIMKAGIHEGVQKICGVQNIERRDHIHDTPVDLFLTCGPADLFPGVRDIGLVDLHLEIIRERTFGSAEEGQINSCKSADISRKLGFPPYLEKILLVGGVFRGFLAVKPVGILIDVDKDGESHIRIGEFAAVARLNMSADFHGRATLVKAPLREIEITIQGCIVLKIGFLFHLIGPCGHRPTAGEDHLPGQLIHFPGRRQFIVDLKFAHSGPRPAPIDAVNQAHIVPKLHQLILQLQDT